MPVTHLLARSVIQKQGRVLVVRADGQPHTFLPGGHVEEDEGVEECLRRELWEELGIDARIGAYRGAVEHQWYRDGNRHYELNHCFTVEVPSLSPDVAPTAREAYLTFDWVPAGDLNSVDLQPPPLRRLLVAHSDGMPWWASTVSGSPAADDRKAVSL